MLCFYPFYFFLNVYVVIRIIILLLFDCCFYVFAGIHNTTKEKFAVKIVDRTKLSHASDRSLRREVEILKSIDHPNIVKCYDFYEDANSYHIVIEYMQGMCLL